jgi:hypothetical protein
MDRWTWGEELVAGRKDTEEQEHKEAMLDRARIVVLPWTELAMLPT